MELKQSKGLNRNVIDKFYTKHNVVELCMNYFKENIIIDNNDLIIEPSAGNGSFINNIKLLKCKYKFYDLEPEIYLDEIQKQDYLLLDTSKLKIQYNNIHIIGNPPFGRQSSLAKKFIKKSCLYCDSLSFILPKSFKKDSLKKTFPLNFHCIFEIDLPKNSFLVNEYEYNVETIFQIWIKKNYERVVNEKIEPIHFKFVNINDNPDISFRRVGVYAGKIDTNIQNKSVQSHYFIKFTNKKSTDENIKLLEKINFDFNNTVGPKSISKQELIKEFNKYI